MAFEDPDRPHEARRLRRGPPAPSEDVALGRMLTPADYVSIGNALLGVLAVFLISLGHVEWAVLAILAAIIGDGVDGAVARLGYGGGPFGGKLDSFADFATFGVAPATLLFHTYYQWEIVTDLRGPDILTALAVGATAAGFILGGMLRLIRFEVIGGSRRADFFVGLSIPAAALMVTLPTWLGWASRHTLALTWTVSLLMVSRVKFPKVRGPLMAPALLALFLAIAIPDAYDQAFPKLLFSMMATYVVIGPFFVRWRAQRMAEYEAVWET